MTLTRGFCKEMIKRGKWTSTLCSFCLVRNPKECEQKPGLKNVKV